MFPPETAPRAVPRLLGDAMASSTPSTPHRASCRTADFREAVQRQRALHSLPTPASELLPRAKRKSAFTADSLSCLQEVGAMQAVLRESHAAYVLDEALGGMAEAERDGVDAETQRCLKASNSRIDALKLARHRFMRLRFASTQKIRKGLGIESRPARWTHNHGYRYSLQIHLR